MKKQHVNWNHRSQDRKVVRLRLDAGFFFERAVKFLDRHNYDKALKYFRLAVEKEPDNPVNQCNLAGILSEMGRFEESNQVLENVLREVDPELYECYFYMANNAANMEEFEMAEEYLLRYLEEEPDGEFADEAEEMLQMLAYELGRKPRRPEVSYKQAWMKRHDEARVCLEQGHFLQAAEILERLVKEHPDFLAAWNNLALAYYYTGQMERAAQTILQVLDKDPNNLHALCNLAVLCQHQGEKEHRDRLVNMLKKWVPYHTEHMYKLATTMGVLGEHETAYRLFRQLLKLDGDPEPALYHYVATASCNTGRFRQARKYWRMARDLDPESDIPVFYLNQLERWEDMPPECLPTVSYHYQLPFEEQFLQLGQVDSIPEQIKHNPLIRSSFFWALHHGDRDTKLQVLQVFQWIADKEVEQVLRSFLMKKEEDDDLKRLALYVLRQIGVKNPCRAFLEGKEVEIHPGRIGEEMPAWMETWARVLECCLKGMDGQYDVTHMNDAQIIWAEFVRQNQAKLPEIRKVEGWAAALEYVVAKLHGLSLTQAGVARKHDVSASTVGRHVRELEKVCTIQRGSSEFT